jgi:hypothetical protein
MYFDVLHKVCADYSCEKNIRSSRIFLMFVAMSYNNRSGWVFKNIQMKAAMVVYPEHASVALLE